MNALAAIMKGRSTAALASRFMSVGVLATLSYLVLANLGFALTDADPSHVSVAAYLGGILVSYIGQSRVTFQVAGDSFGQIMRFLVCSLIGLVISYQAIRFTSDVLDMPVFYGTAAVCVVIPILNFIVMKFWVFTD